MNGPNNMKFATAAAVALLLGGCATMQQPKPIAPNIVKAAPKIVRAAPKHAELRQHSPTANQVVKRRWFSGFKVRLFH